MAEVSDCVSHVINMENDSDSNLADVSHQVIKMEDGGDPHLVDESEDIIKMEKGSCSNLADGSDCTSYVIKIEPDDDIAQCDVKNILPFEGACPEHEHTFNRDDKYLPSLDPQTSATTDEVKECEDKPYKRILCTISKSFSRSDDLLRHTRTHHDAKPFSCDHCMKSFSQKSNLVSHINY
jgi:hypothetical protein